LLKDLLLTCAVAVPRTHDPQHLASLLASSYPALGPQHSLLATLSSWGTITRYPMPEQGTGPNADEIAQAIEPIDRLILDIRSLRHAARPNLGH
jgi:hypothetical protein